jgi:hypothetical protein
MVAPKIFRVLTEFKFEVSGALLSSKLLHSSLNEVSDAAKEAKQSLFGLGSSFLFRAGLGGGLFGFASSAVMAAEKFAEGQRSFANIIGANLENFSGTVDTFVGRMGVGAEAMRKIARESQKFGLSEADLGQQAKLLGGFLSPKGLSGTNFEVPIELARNLLKSAPILGVSPGDVEGQMIRMLEGQASTGDPLFRRLGAETKALAGFTDPKKFNMLPITQRLDLMRKALNTFGNDADVNADRLNSLSAQMNVFSSLVKGADSIFMGIGQTLRKFVVNSLTYVNARIDVEGRAIATSFGNILEMVLREPISSFEKLLHLGRLKGDLEATERTFATTGLVVGLAHIAKWAGIISGRFIPLLGVFTVFANFLGSLSADMYRFNPIVAGLVETFGKVTLLLGSAGVIIAALAGFKVLGATLAFIGGLIPPIAAAFMAFSIVSRAIAKAQVESASVLPEFTARLAQSLEKLTKAMVKIFTPFEVVIEQFSKLLVPFFSIKQSGSALLDFLEMFASAMDSIGNFIIRNLAFVSGLFEAIFVGLEKIFEIVENRGIGSLVFDKGVPNEVMDVMGQGLLNGYRQFINQAKIDAGSGGLFTANNQITMNVEMRNDFKENMEPDRIAFTIRDQLTRAAVNPTQAIGKSSRRGLIPAYGAGY